MGRQMSVGPTKALIAFTWISHSTDGTPNFVNARLSIGPCSESDPKLLILQHPDMAEFSEFALIRKENWTDFDSAIRTTRPRRYATPA
jgi:hypothetical protein